METSTCEDFDSMQPAGFIPASEESIMKELTCLTFTLLSLLLNQAFACTTFCLHGKGEVLFGRNYDWTIGDALVLVNKRGVAKTATIIDSDNGAKWRMKARWVTAR